MNLSNKHFQIYRIISAVLSVACMILIFSFSTENGDNSSETSSIFSEFAVEHFFKNYDELSPEEQSEILAETDHIIRKTAHFSIYAALGFFVSCAFGKRKTISYGSLASLLICFAYACSDEFHQYFVPGRSSRFTDVLIDTSGALTGILISMILFKILNKIKNSP